MRERQDTKGQGAGDMAAGITKKEGYLTGKLLIAMPQLGDTRFHKAVIFICAHDENGAMGLVVNHILPGLELPSLLDQLAIDGTVHKTDMPVMSGGPVETARGFILHEGRFEQIDSLEIEGNIYVTGTIDALKAVARGEGPPNMLFILGYAGWTAGQLDHELQDNAWLVTDADPAVIFGGDPEERWGRAVRKIGIDPSMLSANVGRA